MGRGFGSLGWQEKEKGQVQLRGPGLGPQRVPLGPLFCTPYPHPCHPDPGACTSLPPVVSLVLCQDTSPAPLQPSQPSLPSRARFFPCLDPTVAVLCPFLSISQGSGCSSCRHIPVTLEPGNYPGNEFPIHSSLFARRQLPTGSTLSAHCTLTIAPLLQPPEGWLVTAAWEARRPPPSTTVRS